MTFVRNAYYSKKVLVELLLLSEGRVYLGTHQNCCLLLNKWLLFLIEERALMIRTAELSPY